MEQHFDSINSLIVSLFKQESTAVLPLERICKLIEESDSIVLVENEGEIPASTLPRRKIASSLQNSENFVQIAKCGESKWALRYKIPVSISDSELLGSIEKMFTTLGPITIHQLAQNTEIPGVDASLFLRIMTIHSSEFSSLPDGTWWFADQPLPERIEYHNLTDAIEHALKILKKAKCEQIYWFLCLSTIDGQVITQNEVLYHLTHNDDLYIQPERNIYQLIIKPAHPVFSFAPRPSRRRSIPIEPNDAPFDPDAFFGKSTPFVFGISL